MYRDASSMELMEMKRSRDRDLVAGGDDASATLNLDQPSRNSSTLEELSSSRNEVSKRLRKTGRSCTLYEQDESIGDI